MQPAKPYFDLLEDGLVQQVIKCGPTGYEPWKPLSRTCRRMCRLVRQTQRVRIVGSAKAVLTLAEAPESRFFEHVVQLDMTDLPATGRKQAACNDAIAAAVDAWPGLEKVCLQEGKSNPKKPKLSKYSDVDYPDWVPPGFLLPLQDAQALRQLKVVLAHESTLVRVAALTQLTRLELETQGDGMSIVGRRRRRSSSSSSPKAPPLAAMTNLVSLHLEGWELDDSMPPGLPPNLTRLELFLGCGGWAGWDRHVGNCRQLRVLVMPMARTLEVTSHPSVVLQSLAPHLTALQQLVIWQGEVDDEEDVGNEPWDCLERAVHEMMHVAGSSQAGLRNGSWWPVNLPLGPAHGYRHPDSAVVLPPPNMGALVNLQHLDFNNWWLVVSSDHYWRALGGCSSLKSLKELHVSWPPPAGVTFPHLTRLDVTTSTSSGDTVTLLGAFPALRTLQLKVAPVYAEDSKPKRQVVLPELVTAAITLLEPLVPPAEGSGGSLAGYCSRLWGALPGLKRLKLEWPGSAWVVPHMASMSDLQQLSKLEMTSEQAYKSPCAELEEWEDSEDWDRDECGYAEGCGWQLVKVQEVLRVLRPLRQLKRLQLQLAPEPDSTWDQLVLGLQEALPALTWLAALPRPRYGYAVPKLSDSLEPATLAALRRGLRVGYC